MSRVVFHLTDRCNLRCSGCHWFSSAISIVNELKWKHYVEWAVKNRNKINLLVLSGGEPTLHEDFDVLVSNLPEEIPLRINTNGTNIGVLEKIKRQNVHLCVSENRKISDDFENKIISLGIPCRFYSFNGIGGRKNKDNELDFGIDLIGKKGKCFNRYIRFGVDGWAYNCEVGLRTKSKKLRCSFSLWEGEMENLGKECEITEECASNFCGENYLRISE